MSEDIIKIVNRSAEARRASSQRASRRRKTLREIAGAVAFCAFIAGMWLCVCALVAPYR